MSTKEANVAQVLYVHAVQNSDCAEAVLIYRIFIFVTDKYAVQKANEH